MSKNMQKVNFKIGDGMVNEFLGQAKHKSIVSHWWVSQRLVEVKETKIMDWLLINI